MHCGVSSCQVGTLGEVGREAEWRRAFAGETKSEFDRCVVDRCRGRGAEVLDFVGLMLRRLLLTER